MEDKSRWVVRTRKCPEGGRAIDLLVEWRIEKGKKILHSVSCNHPGLAEFGGKECRWGCVQRLPGGKK